MSMLQCLRTLVVCITVAATASAGPAATIRVPADHATLAAAVAAAVAGDTLQVAEGTYVEEITVDRVLTITGAGPGQTVLSCREDGTVITANADLTLEGLTIGPARDGVMLAAGRTLRLSSCRIADCKDNGLNFASDFQSRLYMADCEVTRCGDGVDLESTQGQAVNCSFHDNSDDGLDYDGDAGFLCVGCRFMDNADDGIEVRLARRAEVVLVFCTFGGNGEDGLELINTRKLDPADNMVAVSHCKFQGNGRYDLGCVDLLTPEGEANEKTSDEPPHAAVYLCANEFARPVEQCCSPNIPPILAAAGQMPEQVAVAWTPEGQEQRRVTLTPSTPALAGIINLQPNFQGGKVGDAEGLAIGDSYLYVGDDSPGTIHCLDRGTGALLKSASTAPFPGSQLTFTGPEGLTILPETHQARLLVLDDAGDRSADAAIVRESPTEFGQLVRHVPMPRPEVSTEGVAAAGDVLYLAQGRNALTASRLGDPAPLAGFPVSYLFDGKSLHIAGAGYNGAHVILCASAYPGRDPDAPVPENYLLAVDPADGKPVSLQWVGAYCNDARGVACADDLVFLSDGWSHRTLASGFVNKRGQKILIFAAPDVEAVVQASRHLPVRHFLQPEPGP